MSTLTLTFDDSAFYTIVGVAGDVRGGALREDPDQLQAYQPEIRIDRRSTRVILRTSGNPSTALAAARVRLAEIDPALPLREPATARDIVREQTARSRFLAQLLASFGALSLLLAVTGVYGVVALDVSRRTREVGIRVALGAGSGRVLGK